MKEQLVSCPVSIDGMRYIVEYKWEKKTSLGNAKDVRIQRRNLFDPQGGHQFLEKTGKIPEVFFYDLTVELEIPKA